MAKRIYNRVCPVCGTKFSTGDKRKIYCCPGCGKKAVRKYQKEYQKKKFESLRARPKQVACAVCGKMFEPVNIMNKWCSKECYEKSKAASHDEVACKWCGKKFVQRRSTNVYCCSECAEKAVKSKIHKLDKELKQERAGQSDITPFQKRMCILWTHLRAFGMTATNAKPYTAETCAKIFNIPVRQVKDAINEYDEAVTA